MSLVYKVQIAVQALPTIRQSQQYKGWISMTGVAIKKVPLRIHDLELDLTNPRFGLLSAKDEDEALAILAERANLKELWDSINSQGWLDFEPIVATPSESTPDKYTVIEGNRRIAAIFALYEPSRLPDRLARRVPPLSEIARSTLNDGLTVAVVDDRRSADAFIGFKHVNGPASWGPLPKAKFASDMFSRGIAEGKDAGDVLSEIENALGDTTTSLLRMLVAYKIIEQAVEIGLLDQEEVEKGTIDFSHLYTMMPNPATREFLGLTSEPLRSTSIVDAPIPEEFRGNLSYMMGWLFGSEDIEKVIRSQGTDRPDLQKVLAHEAAVDVLKVTGDLKSAVAKAGLDVDKWQSRLIKAERDAKQLVSDLSEIQGRMEDDVLERAIETTNSTRRAFGIILASLKTDDED